MSEHSVYLVSFPYSQDIEPEDFARTKEAMESLIHVMNALEPEGPWLELETGDGRIYFAPTDEHLDGDPFDLRRDCSEHDNAYGEVLTIRAESDRYRTVIEYASRLASNLTDETVYIERLASAGFVA